MVGVNNTIYLIDFELGLRYHDPYTGHHIPAIKVSDIVGTVRYTSVNSHMRLQQSRRDDLESLAYTLAYLVQGKLPWQNISSRNPNRNALVLRKKQKIGEEICVGVPSPITTFLHYARSLAFEGRPDYVHVHSLMQSCISDIS